MSFSFQGVIPAVWTPTDANGALLKDALRSNLQFIQRAKVDALLILGSTGEFIHFSLDERKEILDTAIDFAEGTPVLVNISHTNPRSVAELARHAKTAGAVAVTLLPPWFFPLSDADLVAFFANATRATDLPLGLYNFPNLTGKHLSPELVRMIYKERPFAGLKQSGGEFPEHKAIIDLGRELGFDVLTGWDTHIPEAMALGAKGCIGGLGNFVPELKVRIVKAIKENRAHETSMEIAAMKQIGQVVNTLEFPLNVAAAMEARGLKPGAPKQVVSTETQTRYNTLREEFRRLFRELNLESA
jgi:2-dehydro-3-deoxy-D-pentonate aldolase